MSISELERLLDRWSTDPAFREAVRRQPTETISQAGYALDETEWAAIDDTDWSRPEDVLRARMSNLLASPPA